MSIHNNHQNPPVLFGPKTGEAETVQNSKRTLRCFTSEQRLLTFSCLMFSFIETFFKSRVEVVPIQNVSVLCVLLLKLPLWPKRLRLKNNVARKIANCLSLLSNLVKLCATKWRLFKSNFVIVMLLCSTCKARCWTHSIRSSGTTTWTTPPVNSATFCMRTDCLERLVSDRYAGTFSDEIELTHVQKQHQQNNYRTLYRVRTTTLA